MDLPTNGPGQTFHARAVKLSGDRFLFHCMYLQNAGMGLSASVRVILCVWVCASDFVCVGVCV